MKVLMIETHEFLENQDNGGRKASLRNYNLLKKAVGEENVHLCIFSNDTKSDPQANIKVFPKFRNKIEQMIAILTQTNQFMLSKRKEILDYIEELNPDVIFFDFSILGKLITKLDKKYKTIVFMHNVERDYAYDKVKNESIFYFPFYLSYRENEKKMMEYVDHIICFNTRDAQRVKEVYSRDTDLLVPITFKDCFEYKYIDDTRTKILLFVGSNFGPNLSGITWFVKNIMPKLPDYKLLIVGRGMEKNKDDLIAENVEVVGSVDDLSTYYYKADAMVMPILYGGGMKVKTAEALMYGKTIFACREALVGYDVENVENIYECNTEKEFIESVKNYMEREDRSKYNQNVRDFFLKNYETQAIQNDFSHFINCVGKE